MATVPKPILEARAAHAMRLGSHRLRWPLRQAEVVPANGSANAGSTYSSSSRPILRIHATVAKSNSKVVM